jgi:hypothetical protein
MHSAAWDSEYDLTDKVVAVIGGGSSAVQIIPSIQKKVKKLYPFLRSPVWITAGFGSKHAAPGGVNFECKCAPFKSYLSSHTYPCLRHRCEEKRVRRESRCFKSVLSRR